ncbi:hypothetical protein ACFYUL_09915 [Streptomyces sp. NPDC004311]|uniref:hypothetical protein n=1 Tax=Streptomyces sp. NPDC004311 TaxID=3364698 RepID=UPI0036903D79
MSGVVRTAVRGAAGAGALVTLAVAGWLVWAVAGPQTAAMLGVGPVDGVIRVGRCYEAVDVEGYTTGTDCEGSYLPRTGGGPSRDIVLDTAADTYRPGTEVEVRTARGRAYELSGTAVFNSGTGIGLLLVPFLTLAAWLSACVRRGRAVSGDGYFLAALAGLVAVMVLAALAGLLVGAALMVF